MGLRRLREIPYAEKLLMLIIIILEIVKLKVIQHVICGTMQLRVSLNCMVSSDCVLGVVSSVKVNKTSCQT